MVERTEITITIDTECSIAGAFENPEENTPVAEQAIMCIADGKEQGLGFLLDTFSKYNITASFFVECAQYYYFGDEPMKTVMQRILDAGQDAQLHIHPCWLNYNKDPKIGQFSRDDDCIDREYDELKRIFELSLEVFERWAGKRPEAIRTGGLVADLNVYRVMRDLNIPLATNVAMGGDPPFETELQLMGGRTTVDGVMELPVFSYQDMDILGKRHVQSLQITSCSWPEMKYLLRKARAQGIENIVILTHPFEYIKKTDRTYKKITRNRVNQNRLQKLCQFISENDQDFVSVGFGGSCEKWLKKGDIKQDLMKIPSYYMVGRKLHNKFNDTIWKY